MMVHVNGLFSLMSWAQWVELCGIVAIFLTVNWTYRLVCSKAIQKTRNYCLLEKMQLLFIAFILWSTLFLRTPGTVHQANLIPLWSWYLGFLQGDDEIRWQIYFNILLFVPFGCLLHLRKPRPMSRIFLRGFLFSLIIELCQLVFKLGLFEWDDMLHNSLGCLLGGFAAKVLERVWNIHRLHKTAGRK